jgi:hypothetical protein
LQIRALRLPIANIFLEKMQFKALLTLGLCLLLTQANECDKDADCRSLNTCEDEECVHKALVTIHGYEWAATIGLLIFTTVAKSVGLGSKA